MTATMTTMNGTGREDEWTFNTNGFGDVGQAERKPVRAKFVRCPMCREEKQMCDVCKKRQNREASQRHRLKNQRNQEALEHLRATVRTLQEQRLEDRKLIEQLLICGAGQDKHQHATGSSTVTHFQASSPVSQGAYSALIGSTFAQHSGSCYACPTHQGLISPDYKCSTHAHDSVLALPLPNCEQHYGSCNNRMPTTEAIPEDIHRSTLLLSADLADFEPTLAELNLGDDWDSLYMDTSMQGSQYGDQY